MEIRQLKTFTTVADLLSFTKASNRLYMAQSSVSAQVKALEEELGITLFDRIGRRVLITDAGRKLYAYARRMEEMTREIQSEFANDRYAQGTLTVRAPETLASVYMPKVVDRFHEDHPKVKLDFINCSDEQLREELNTGRIDLAFLITDSIHMKDVTVRRLRTEKLVLVSGPTHPLAQSKNVALSHLTGQTLLLPKTDWNYPKAFERSLEEKRIRPIILRFSSIRGMRACLKRGMGITICPEVSVEEELKQKSLTQLTCRQGQGEASLIMIWHSEKWCSPLLRDFIGLSEKVISESF